MRRIITTFLFICFLQTILSGKGKDNALQPRLVIGIVIDQMRYDYLYRFYDQYSENGFKRLMKEGMNFTYAQYNYIPTYTGPGHSSIYTGATPYYHGIIANDWYDKKLKKSVYCVRDPDVKAVGTGKTGNQMSPKNLLVTTMTDQLRMSDNGLSKVFSISLKDRAAILPGGHMANAAYWYDGKSGKFITSTYYMNELPSWVDHFNGRKLPSALMNSGWKLEGDKDYQVSFPDNGPGEEDVFKEGKTTFPHLFSNLSDSAKLDFIRSTPYGNELLTDFFTELLKSEKPGQGNQCDFVAVSFSSPDYVGHAYGPNSTEIMDLYLKLDKQVARLLDTLDQCIGKGNYLLFLTADHAVKLNNAYLEANKIPSGIIPPKSISDLLTEYCRNQFGTDRIIEMVADNQVYLNHSLLDSLKLNTNDVDHKLISFMRAGFPFMGLIMTKEELLVKSPERSMNSFILNGFNIQRSGDVVFELTPNQIISSDGKSGTTHGSSYDYDTHVPLIFYGWHIKPGESNKEVFVEDIAPTITNLIHIQEPDATLGIPIIKP